MAEPDEDPEKQRLQNVHTKGKLRTYCRNCRSGIPFLKFQAVMHSLVLILDYIVVLFADQRCTLLHVGGARSSLNWRLDDRAVYGETLQLGDFLIVKHPLKMDRLQQSSKAEVRLVTTDRKAAELLVKQLEEAAIVRFFLLINH